MHFTVAVVTKDGSEEEIDKLLAPFDEDLEVDPYVYMTKEEIIKEVRKKRTSLEEDMAWYARDPEGYLKEYNIYWLTKENIIPRTLIEYWGELLGCKTDEDFYNYYRKYNDTDYDENGNELSTYNPKSKWDYYTVGGRWDGYFDLKNGSDSNSAPIKNIIWEKDDNFKNKCKRFWEVVVEHQPLVDGEDKDSFFNLYKESYYINRYHTKEEYAQRCAEVSPYAVVTPEGEWVAPGEIGWFSSSETDEDQAKYEEWFKEFVKEHQDYWITLVDCHI